MHGLIGLILGWTIELKSEKTLLYLSGSIPNIGTVYWAHVINHVHSSVRQKMGDGRTIGGMSDRQNPVRLVEDNRQNHDDHFVMLS